MTNRIKNPFSWGTQNHRLLERLILGPIRSREIVESLRILAYDQALGDVRKAVREQGGDLVSEPQDRKRTDWENRLIQPGQQGLF